MRPSDPDEVTTLLTRKVDTTPVSDLAFTLAVVEGPDAGASFVIDASQPSRALLGTSPACAARLRDREVSRRHAAIELEADGLRVTDLRSTNGTFVNGVRIDGAHLSGGELVRIGASALRVDRAAPGARIVVPAAVRFGRFVGASTEVRRLYPLCARLAASNVPLVIEGETGTGKEVLAESIHDEGPRASGPFVVFDCTQVAPTLVESELFGHERGAFTGATALRKGVFEQAHGGTLLIDEVGDLDAALQPKLLRALERGEIRRVGGDRWIKVDVRVIAATRRDLDRAVQEGRFRDDLFHRLAVARVELPRLRRRRGDVSILVRHFVAELGGAPDAIPNALLNRWEQDEWPGNVRELRNAVARRIALGDLAELGAGSERAPTLLDGEETGDLIERVLSKRLPLAMARELVIDELERRYVERTLADHGGNVSHAAKASGVARRHFQRLKAKAAR